MEHTPMPEPMRRAVDQLTSEAVERCQEVLSYAGSDVACDWKRMTLYRATDAADTTDCVAMLIAAYCRHTGMAPETLQGYLRLGRQQSRAGPRTKTGRTWPVCWARRRPPAVTSPERCGCCSAAGSAGRRRRSDPRTARRHCSRRRARTGYGPNSATASAHWADSRPSRPRWPGGRRRPRSAGAGLRVTSWWNEECQLRHMTLTPQRR
ncbi:hypothetical protein OIE62_39700 [Streptomyces scopuliridis]|uniref:Uncharacterized protein n=1 Tax=Streptomyces scopuliridis TaxID=452529 RepID=A0ACD4ZBN1_9ACTN|nr:hypothetical protein [Streptomyces scopuliridis]WSB95780.1 hypothetical protein OG835_01225 [Streptomyces scopuliridis]WSC10513.1 hypothetical protein OIE62_39700 [Streptomyces scopuliridis]